MPAALAPLPAARVARALSAYPSRPVKIIAPVQPGGGVIACQSAAMAAPDGYTLMVGCVGTHGTNPAVRKVPYDTVKDFTAIAMVGVLVVHPSVPATDLKGLIEFAKNSPATCGSSEEESGFKGFDGVRWYGIMGPARLPDAITRKLNESINAALATPELRERLAGEALEPMPMGPEQFRRYVEADIARWTRPALLAGCWNLGQARDVSAVTRAATP